MIVRQVLAGSILTWVLNGLLMVCIHFFGDRPWGDALQVACWFVAIFVLFYGAVGLGGGIVAIPSQVFRMLATSHRDRVTDDPGGLTPLGLALFVIPQLIAVAALLG